MEGKLRNGGLTFSALFMLTRSVNSDLCVHAHFLTLPIPSCPFVLLRFLGVWSVLLFPFLFFILPFLEFSLALYFLNTTCVWVCKWAYGAWSVLLLRMCTYYPWSIEYTKIRKSKFVFVWNKTRLQRTSVCKAGQEYVNKHCLQNISVMLGAAATENAKKKGWTLGSCGTVFVLVPGGT